MARTPPLITTFCFQGLAACGDGEDIRVGKVAGVLEEVVRRRRRQERKRRLVFVRETNKVGVQLNPSTARNNKIPLTEFPICIVVHPLSLPHC